MIHFAPGVAANLQLDPEAKAAAAEQGELSPTPKLPEVPARIRKFSEADTNFVLSSWMRSFRGEDEFHRHIPTQLYWHNQQVLIGKIAATSEVYVACAEDDPSCIFGWICAEVGRDGSLIVHYTYVKQVYRRLGIARRLLTATGWQPGQPIFATHWTNRCSRLSEKFNVAFNPYILKKGF